MKQVRILKSGKYNNVYYNEGEIWNYVEEKVPDRSVIIKKGMESTIVTIVEDSSYGKEAEIIDNSNILINCL